MGAITKHRTHNPMADGLIKTGINHEALPGAGKTVGILGVPLAFGQSMLGVELGPAATRVAGLASAIGKTWL